MVVQGTTISFVARILNLSKPLEKTGNDFGVELPEEIDTDLKDMTITQEMLEEADTLKDMNLPKGTLVMIVKRGDEFLIPNGTLKLHEEEHHRNPAEQRRQYEWPKRIGKVKRVVSAIKRQNHACVRNHKRA